MKKAYLNCRKLLLCALALSIFSKKLSVFQSGEDVKRILFIRIDRIGDMVMSTPALKAIKNAFPTSELTVLASPSNQSLLFNNPYVDKIIVYGQRRKTVETIKVLRQLRKHKLYLAIDPYAGYELKTALIPFLSGAEKRVGYASYGREVFFNIRGPEIENNRHIIDLTLDVLKSIGIVAQDRTPEIFLAEDEERWARNWLKNKGIGDKPIIGIHPGAYYETQRWLPESFADLAKQLLKAKEVDLILFGGTKDKELIDRISSIVNNKEVRVYIAHDLRSFASLLSCCHLFICNNSGPLHMAIATDTPTVSFMGPTIKERWMPIGDIHTVLRADNLSCIGCNLGICEIETHDCMRLITPSMVINVIENFLNQ
jgi:heptosyltransferase-2